MIIKIIAQTVGMLGFGFAISSYQMKSQKGIILLQLLCNAAFCTQFLMLGAYTGGILNFISLIRAIVYYNKGKTWADNLGWVILFPALSVITAICTWDGGLCLLPCAAMIISTFSLRQTDAKRVRLMNFPASPCWLIYNIFTGSIGGALAETLSMCSIIIALIRYDIPWKKRKQE